MTIVERARAAIEALRTPDASLARVPNTVRQSIAETIEALVTPVGDGRQICECPKCGRNHWRLGNPPGAMTQMDETTNLRRDLTTEREITAHLTWAIEQLQGTPKPSLDDMVTPEQRKKLRAQDALYNETMKTP